MRALAIVFVFVVALSSISRSAPPAPNKTLAEFILPRLNGVAAERMPEFMVPRPDVAAAYLDAPKSDNRSTSTCSA